MGKRLWLSVVACLMAVTAAFAQHEVTGVVIDAQTGEPVVGAAVVVAGTSVGQVTDIEGRFTFASLPAGAKNLKVTYLGMKDQTVAVKPKLRVYLESETTKIDDVLVVAYGATTKAAFTGSASVIKAEDIAESQSSNALDALNGKSAGVQMFSSSNQPGQSSPTIRVRGITSINASNAPLIVLDGAMYDGDLNSINSADIESISILKDAASNALYGAHGANGVIIITTKRAQAGEQAKVTLDAKWGSNSRSTRRYKTVNSTAGYYEQHYKALKNLGLDKGLGEEGAHQYANQNLIGGENGLAYNVYNVPAGQWMIGENGKLNPYASLGNVVSYGGQEFTLRPDDWVDAAFQNGLRQEYTVTAQSATQTSNFYASGNYMKSEGITVNSVYERLNGRLKAESNLKSWLKVGANMSFTHAEGKSMSEDGTSNSSGNPLAVANQVAPIYPLYLRDGQGNRIHDENTGTWRYDFGERDNAGLERPQYSGCNPLLQSQIDEDQYEGNMFDATGTAEARFLTDFRFQSINSVSLDETRSTSTTNPWYGQYASLGGSVYKAHSRRYSYNFQQLLSWAHSFGLHNVDATVGHDYHQYKYYFLSAQKSGMFLPSNDELNGAITDKSPSSYRTEYNTEGWIFRGQYNYDEKYFGSVSFRRDASSRFYKNDWWGNFFSLGGAWVMNKEKWFPHDSFVNFLKLKASYGENGNDLIGSFLYTNVYGIANSNGHASVVPDQEGTRDISWEKSHNFNAGVEFEMFKSRLSGSVDFFYRKTTDMLFYIQNAPSYGWQGHYDNVGDMRNRGIEVTLDGDIIRSKDLKWSASFNITHYRNKILKINKDNKNLVVEGHGGYTSGNKFYGEDKSIYTFYMEKFAGVNPETGAQQWWKDIKEPVVDADGNPVLDETGAQKYKITGRETTENYSEASKYLCGTALPDVYGGFGTRVEWKGFDFAINFAYQLGGKVFDSDYQLLMGAPTSNSKGHALHADMLNAWTPENNKSDIPRYVFGDKNSNASSDRFLTSASYLAINNINVGYTLPKFVTRRLQVDKVRVYLSADNVALWSKRQGLDPRQSIAGSSTNALYSPIRTISGGISLTF